MKNTLSVRPIAQQDYDQWRSLWDGYNAFYGRVDQTALPEQITAVTWGRFFNDVEPVHGFVAEHEGCIVGLVHYLFHRSTTRLNDVCYLQDLYTMEAMRGKGIGRLLIHAVYEAAEKRKSSRVYWTTHATNSAGRVLYDKVAKHAGFIIYGYEI